MTILSGGKRCSRHCQCLTRESVDKEVVARDCDAVLEVEHGVGHARRQEDRLAGPLHELNCPPAVELEGNGIRKLSEAHFREASCLPSFAGAVVTRAGTSARWLKHFQ